MEKFPSVIVLEKNPNSQEVMGSYLKDLGVEDIKFYDDYNQGYEYIKSLGNQAVVFIDIPDNQDLEKQGIVENIKLYTPQIVITSTDYSTDNIVKAMRIGAKEFLPKPLIKDDLKRVLTLLQKIEPEEESASKIIAVYSNKGGIGKTTVAVNLAAEIARTTGDKTALVDLNLQLGDVSTFLNLNPTFDVSYVINNLMDKKEDALIKAFEQYKNTNLYVLSDPNYIEQSVCITPQKIEKLFSALKKVFPFIVVDLSSNIDENSLKILDISDLILFTTIVNIPAIRNAQRCLNLFKSRRYPQDKVKVVLNRYMENDEIKLEDIETTLGEKVYWKIPNNYFSIMEAINKGVTVSEVSTNSNIANSFRDFAGKIADDMAETAVLKYRI
mgnify:CR=1 FL=1